MLFCGLPPSRNGNHETPQTAGIVPGPVYDPSLLVKGPWGKGTPAQKPQAGLDTPDPAELCSPAPLGSGAGLGITLTSPLEDQGLT